MEKTHPPIACWVMVIKASACWRCLARHWLVGPSLMWSRLRGAHTVGFGTINICPFNLWGRIWKDSSRRLCKPHASRKRKDASGKSSVLILGRMSASTPAVHRKGKAGSRGRQRLHCLCLSPTKWGLLSWESTISWTRQPSITVVMSLIVLTAKLDIRANAEKSGSEPPLRARHVAPH